MVATTLVKSERDLGWELLAELEQRNFQVEGAFWLYLDEAENWRFYLINADLDQEGSNKLYGILQGHINQMPKRIQEEFSVMNISLISPGDRRIKEMKERYEASVLKDIAAGRTDALAKDVPDPAVRARRT